MIRPKPYTMTFSKTCIGLMLLFSGISGILKSQTATVSWPLTANTSSVVSGEVSAFSQLLSGLSVNNYLSGNGGQRLVPDGGSWPAETAPNSGRYTEYAFVANTSLSLQTVMLSLSFNSSSAGRARICWSAGGTTFTDLSASQTLVSGSVPSMYSFSGLNISLSAGDTFRLRVYPWSTSALSGRYLVTKDVQLSAAAEATLLPAFPGAEGGGRQSVGGRGGSIYYVTNLNNSGAGSLRDAVSQSGRTILFKVSGTINLLSPLVIQRDNITIAGQTAPGDGICLANYGVRIMANNVIIRYIRSRPGDIILNPEDTTKVVDAMYNSFGTPVTNPYRNVIIDHCSLSWCTDELGSFYAIADFTLQWSLLSESLYKSVHDKATPHGYGGIWGGQNASFHHNLMVHNGNRNPRFSGSAATGQPEKEYVDFRNNVVYNWVGSAYGGTGGHHNMIGNYYKPGPATTGNASCANSNRRHRILLYTTYTVTGGDTTFGGKFYVKDNYVQGYSCVNETSDTATNNWRFGVHPDSSPGAVAAMAAGRSDTVFPYTAVTTQTAEDAYVSVTASAGASLPRRDTVDRRIVHETLTGTATYGDTSYQAAGMGIPSGMIDSQNTVGGWPVLSSSTYPNDTDNDGLPDWWEAMINGTADTTSISANALAGDGYTQLEHYINNIQSPDQQVQFLNVAATLSGDDSVAVSFKTDWAKDLFRFRLYRSLDNSSFTKTDSIHASINTISYRLHDFDAPQQVLYYKVGSMRIDGKGNEAFSNVVTIDNSLSGALLSLPAERMQAKDKDAADGGLSVYPSPAADVMRVSHPRAGTRAEIFVYAVSGSLVRKTRAATGAKGTDVTTSGLAAGTYVLVFRDGVKNKSLLFLKR